jgi:tartrate-resistant acid phosphatase type 5
MTTFIRLFAITLSLHAACSLGVVLRAQDKPTDLPLSQALMDQVPDLYKERAQAIRLSAVLQKRYLELPNLERNVFSLITSRIAQAPDGVAFLVEAAMKESVGWRRARLLSRAVFTKEFPAYLAAHPDLLNTYARHAATEPDVDAALQILTSLRRIRQDQLAQLLKQRMNVARASGDQAGLEKLSEEESKRYKWFGEIAMPAVYRDAPPTFSVGGQAEKPIRVLAFGDFGTGQDSQIENAATMRAHHKTRPFDFGITMGDNFYPIGMDSPLDPRWKTQWEDLYSPMGIQFYVSLGNHDYGQGGSPLSEILYSEKSKSWSMPARYYSFTAGAAQFFQVDTVDFSERQARWLGEELAKSTATWKIVYGHYQIYSATRGDNDEQQDDLVHSLLPILKKHKVDLYICGHDHNLQILKPEDGVNFVVAGSGGASTYELDEDYTRTAFQAQTHGFAVIELDRDSLDVRLIDNTGKELSVLPLKKEVTVRQDRQ